MKYEKVHSIYNRLLAIEDIDPTLVSVALVYILGVLCICILIPH